jgi:very-short-patch-repair endonuclease
MEYFISHQSALEFWRGARIYASQNKAELPHKVARTKHLPTKPHATVRLSKEFWEKNGLHPTLSLPVHILVANANARNASQSLRSHVWSQPLPHGSLIDASARGTASNASTASTASNAGNADNASTAGNAHNSLTVSSPEFCFLQMASVLSLEELIKLGYELCGPYSETTDGLPCVQCEKPLTSVARIKAYLAKSQSSHGSRKALRALGYILDGSASPMETNLAMLLCLPNRFGGYGLSRPLLNHRIDITQRVKKTASGRYYRCDLYWPEQKLAIEYDSDAFHTGPQRIADDSKRRNDLSALGITVVTVTKQHINSIKLFAQLAQLIARQTTKRLRLKNPVFMEKHLALRKLLRP